MNASQLTSSLHWRTITNNEVVSDTLWVGAPVGRPVTGVQVSRWGMGFGAGGPCATTGITERHGGYALSGSQIVTVERVENPDLLQLSVSRSLVHPGDSVTFRATGAGGTLLSGVSWGWERDAADSTGVDSTRACTTNPCTVRVWKSGQMRAHKYIGTAYVDGHYRAARARVTVYTNFDLDADKHEIPAGDTVTFTPMLDGKAGGALGLGAG